MDTLMKYTFSNLYEHIESSIERFPFFLNGHGNMFIVRDESIQICEPTEEKRRFYCKPFIPDCTAIVLVPDQKNETSQHISPLISEKIKILQSRKENDLAFVDHGKRPRLKETGIVIKVKKNQEEIKNEVQTQSDQKTETINKIDISNKQEENKFQFNPEDYVMDTEEDFGPLI